MIKRPPASLGKRLLPALAMTTAASGLVALLDHPSSGAAGGPGVGGIAGVGGVLGGASSGAAPGASTASSQPPAVSSTLPAQPSPTVAPLVPGPATPVATATPATPAAPAAGGACTGQTMDGPTINTRWGPVQVEAVISASGQICDVGAIQYPNSHRRSQAINNHALPILHNQVMKAQSLNINGVSGATITTIGYARSLQAILDKVG